MADKRLSRSKMEDNFWFWTEFLSAARRSCGPFWTFWRPREDLQRPSGNLWPALSVFHTSLMSLHTSSCMTADGYSRNLWTQKKLKRRKHFQKFSAVANSIFTSFIHCLIRFVLKLQHLTALYECNRGSLGVLKLQMLLRNGKTELLFSTPLMSNRHSC